MRRFAAVLLSLVFLVTMAATGFAASDVRVRFDEQEVQFDANPFIEDGRTLVPVRALAERLGFTVAWDEGEQKITLTKGDRTVLLWIGSTRVVVNGKESTVDVAPKQVNNRTYVPVRFVAEQLGAHVAWDGNQQIAVITSGKALFAKLNKQQKLADQKLTADLEIVAEMGGGKGGSMTVKVPAHLDLQLYQNTALGHVTVQLPAIMGAGSSDLSFDFAVKDGKAYGRESSATEWDEIGDFDLAKMMTELRTQLGNGGFADLEKLQAELMQDAVVTVAGQEEMDGAKVVHLEIDLSKLQFKQFLEKMFDTMAVPPADRPAFDLKVDRYLLQLWINPDSQFTHKTTVDLAMDVSVTDASEIVSFHMALKGEMRATPMSEPIKFPNLAPSFTSEEQQTAKLYWDAFQHVSVDACNSVRWTVDAHWADLDFTAGHDAAVKAAACFSQKRQALAVLTPPPAFAEGQKQLIAGLETSEKGLTMLAEAFELAAKGDMTTAKAKKAEGQKLVSSGSSQMLDGRSLLSQAARKYQVVK